MRPQVSAIVKLLVLVVLAVSSIWVAPVRAQEPDATVVPDKLNMRYGPGSQYAVIARLARGDALTLIAQDDVPDGEIWVYAVTANGTQGWVSSGYLAVRAGLDIQSLPARPAPDSLGTPAEQPADQPAEQPAAPAAPAAGGFPEGTGIPSHTTDDVNLRIGPGTTYKVIVTLGGGTSILIKGRDASNAWIFASANGQDGWVYAKFTDLSGVSLDSLPVVNTIVEQAAAAPAAEAAGGAPAPVAGGAGLRGFGYGGHVDSFAHPDLMHTAGMTWAKRQIRFRMGMSGGEAAGAISQAHANGFKILLGLVGYPEDMGAPGYYEDYARFVGEVAAQGPDAIEVWNEQNIDREWPNGQIDPGRYTQLLALAYNAIKSANPSVAVISGAPAPTGAEGAFGTAAVWNDDRYVQGMAAAGAAKYMDCIGAHYNEGIVGPSQRSGDPRGDYYTRYFWGMVNTYSRAFGGARPICFTELGYLTPEGLGPLPDSFAWGSNTSVSQQASWLAQAVQLARSSGSVRLVIIWNVDFTNYSGDPMAGYAIIRPDGSCPACNALGG
jgi:uncharacterized protein YraI